MKKRAALHDINRSGRRRKPKSPSLIGPLAMVLTASLVAASCGGGGGIKIDETATDQPTATTEETTEQTPSEPTAEPVAEGSVEDAEAATVKIVGDGTFVPPFEATRASGAGIGTGFIISEDGLVVTNNHVVTGAALLRVYLPGETTPTNARLLGVSECSDLAVLDLDGSGYDFVEFRTDPVNAGLTVFAAGYPLNFDTDINAVDYTLTRGIVSTTQASGETPWASVDGVIEHDARIRGGNSGGPLVDEQGRVVGINFAGDDESDLNFAISASEALVIIEQLKNGNVESIGVNGQAIVTDDLSGVWVSGVESGSPADRAGVKGGDVIVTMEGLDLARDGTLQDYCDIIRTHGPDDVLQIEVIRSSTFEFYEGQLNGSPLTLAFSFGEELADDVGSSAGDTSTYATYEFVSDDSNSVGVEVPAEWLDRDGAPNPDFGPSIYAAPDLQGFQETWDVPGIIVESNPDLTSADIDAVLDIWTPDCTATGREDFQTTDEVFTGRWELFTDCGGTQTAMLAIAASPPSGQGVVRMLVQIVSDRDLDAADHAIATFDAVG